MRLGVPFIAPRDLGAVRAPFGRLWLPSVRGCTGLSGAHQTLNSARTESHMVGRFPVLGGTEPYGGGTELSSALGDRWPSADVAASRWLAGTPDCLALRTDGPMNYSRRRLEFPRAGSWLDRAPDCPVLTKLSDG
jgi:hypothetical protein